MGTNKPKQDRNAYSLYCPPTKKRKRNKNREIKNNNDAFQSVLQVDSMLLTAKSFIFEAMLRTKGNKMEIHADKIKDVEDILFFLKTNILKNDCDIFNVIILAEKYQINGLKEECIHRLVENLSIENFVETINIFHRLEIQNGYGNILEFGKKNNQ